MAKHEDVPARPDDVEPDPRTDGVGDGGQRELAPPTEEELTAGAEHAEQLRRAALAEAGEADDV